MHRRRLKLEQVAIETTFEERYKEVTQKDKGLFCKSCHKWKSWNKIVVSYEISDEQTYRVWFCDDCGRCLREDLL